MRILFGAVLLLLVVAGWLVDARMSTRMARIAFKAAAARLGLSADSVRGILCLSLHGDLDGFALRIAEAFDTQDERQTVFELDTGHRISPEVVLVEEGLGGEIGKLFHGADITTGDPDFDRVVLVRGPEPSLMARLNVGTRAALLRIVEKGGGVQGGRVQMRIRQRLVEAGTIVRETRELLALVRALTHPLDVLTALAEHVHNDPKDGFRLRCLDLLVASDPTHPTTRKALLHACRSDNSPKIRLRAARQLGEEGELTLLGLVRSRSTPVKIAAEAARRLGDRLPESLALQQLPKALECTAPDLLEALLTRLSHHLPTHVVHTLAAPLRPGQDWARAVKVLEVLERTGSSVFEDLLLKALDHPVPEVRAGAARALGSVGTVASIPPLLQLASEHLLELGMRRAALAAVAAIQSRLQAASPGQLSLAADGELGAVSLTEPAAGSVSLSGPVEPQPAAPIESPRRATTTPQRRPERE